ncbi:MAG TPA: MFS transporter [Candidatus Chromulinivoraceae bacterium]|nr:MFS transporter [Candidatus Chromulinivoraceae bacterium]
MKKRITNTNIMIQQLIHRLLLRRHFWRYATFSEVSELYASRMMRMLAINMSAAFMSVFLYQNGYSITFIVIYWICYFTFKIGISLPAAKYAALFGPKHGILLSNLLYIPSMLVFAFVPEWGIVAIVTTGLLQGTSATLYDLCHLIDFSKVKSIDHAGKEIAYMNIVEKIATGLSPLLGGLLAYTAGPQVTMLAAALLFSLAAIPLFKTGEPIPTHQKLVFRGFPWRLVWRSLIAEGAIGFDGLASSSAWSLLVAVSILGISSNNRVYAQLGVLLSIVLLAALAASYAYGTLIDRRRGRQLLKIAGVANALVHLTRPFVNTPQLVAVVNASNEAATTGYGMAFIRGMFDTADISGHRATYLGCIEVVVNVGSALAGVAILLFIVAFGEIQGLRSFYFLAAGVALLITTPKFRLYRK